MPLTKRTARADRPWIFPRLVIYNNSLFLMPHTVRGWGFILHQFFEIADQRWTSMSEKLPGRVFLLFVSVELSRYMISIDVVATKTTTTF